MRRLILLLLFALSGFSGLAYQSLWTYYMGLNLGHAAYAQALTLSVYMGGMALGAWWAGRKADRVENPMRWYAGVEILIGVGALVFHPLFLFYQQFSHDIALPYLGQGWAVVAYQWSSSAAWLFPQSVLLGATFPLLAAALRRGQQANPQKLLGALYGSNCLGAAVGALATTFLLLPSQGVPGALAVAAIINLLVGLGALAMARGQALPIPSLPVPSMSPVARVALVVAAITGATSFVYETTWVRILNQVLGTTMHSFEIMLATFILGLAIGAWWVGVRRKEASWKRVAWAQVLMGCAALASNLVLAHSFVLMAQWVDYVRAEHLGYQAFNVLGAAVAVAVMLPAAIFAGMTLPLITAVLLRQDASDRPIGQVYAANTLGAIVGVMLGMHLLIPLLGLQNSLVLAAAVDALLGVWLFFREGVKRKWVLALLGLLAVFVVASLHFGRFSLREQIRGVYAGGLKEGDDKGFDVVFAKDGKTATVMVGQDASMTWISTNGKTDAGLSRDPKDWIYEDTTTTSLLAALPLAANPSASNAAVIGWGSGMSTHVLLGEQRLRAVDTIEIEPAMREGARHFHDRVWRAYEDPRSTTYFEDARTYFPARGVKYDIVVSEPSNPWVSGVSSLFTQDFYAMLKHHMSDNGVLSQWMHTYSFNDKLLARMIGAIQAEFPNTEVFVSNQSDLIFLSRKSPGVMPPGMPFSATLSGELDAVHLTTSAQLLSHRIAGKEELRTFAQMMDVPPYRDFHPIIDLEAPKARFLEESADGLLDLARSGLPVREMFDGGGGFLADDGLHVNLSLELLNRLEGGEPYKFDMPSTGEWAKGRALLEEDATALAHLSSRPIAAADVDHWSWMATRVFRGSLASAPPERADAVWLHGKWLAPGQPQVVQDLHGAFVAMARKDAASIVATHTHVLEAYPTLPVSVREHMFVGAMLGHVGLRQCGESRALVAAHGSLPRTPALAVARKMVETWAKNCSL